MSGIYLRTYVIAGGLLALAAILLPSFSSTPAFADCLRDRKGKVICDRGACLRDSRGRVFCSAYEDGAVVKDR